ncbi:MAG: KRRI-Interacting protein 1 [Cirrosporium novae-zelandiae]|nr:MAG: KRRI-Interacting protein 1 [Cirrosporium novae-zelandiae]
MPSKVRFSSSVGDSANDGPPSKKVKLLDSDEESSEDESPSESGGVRLDNATLKVNEEYAKRFEHNKKREELHRLEEKYKKQGKGGDEGDENDGSSSDSEDEDDEGILATETLDTEIAATLQAIRSRDPKVYDPNSKFYEEISDPTAEAEAHQKKEKPMYLSDYHRQNLLNGHTENDEEPPRTYAQEQEDLKSNIVKSIYAEGADSDESDSDFLKAKDTKPLPNTTKPEVDVKHADRDPETFLSNFLSARAWIPDSSSRFQPLESDDEEEDKRAEAFEEAYNFRFEDPSKMNEKLMTHSREAAQKYSVRREEKNSRKRTRETEREKKEAEKKRRAEEKARLKKLKVEEMEKKIEEIKAASGLSWDQLKNEDWFKFLEGDFDTEKWENEMQKRFGESYYAGEDGEMESEAGPPTSKSHKPKKPKWDDDIDIKDLVPTFDDSAEAPPLDSDTEKQEKQEKHPPRKPLSTQKQSRRQHADIEALVDTHLTLNTASPLTSKHSGFFRYRESSPQSFGLTPRDILLADDAQLNQYAGLKKLASFRDPEKKRKDKKNLSKKARLRIWRKETFGREEEPEWVVPVEGGDGKGDVDANANGNEKMDAGADVDVDVREGKRKRRRHRKEKKAE